MMALDWHMRARLYEEDCLMGSARQCDRFARASVESAAKLAREWAAARCADEKPGEPRRGRPRDRLR
jgi:hypothetical protein